ADTLALVVRGEPAWESLPPTVPGRVRQALRACLQKDPKQRLGDMQSARLALDGAFETTAATPPPAVMASRERPAWLALAVTALGALAIGGGGAIWLGAARSVDPEPRVFQVETGDGITAPKVSPDGRSVAFVRNDRVVVRELDTGTTRELAGTEGASNPFWSPDGRSIAYFVAGGFEIRALPAGGGASRALVVDSPGKSPHAFAPFGGTWGERGIVFADFSTGLWIVPDGGQPQPFAAVDQATDEVRLAYPSHLPDGRVLAVSIRNVGQPALVAVGEGRRTTLLTLSEGELMWPVLAGSRVVLFERRGANSGIWGIGVSADVSSAQGEPSPVFPDGSSPSVSADNMLVSLSGRRRGDRQLVWVDRQGRTLVEFGKPQSEFNNPDVSPDGITVAVGSGMPTVATAQASTRPRVGSTSAIWLHQAATARRLPLKTPWSTHPAWSPAGDRLAFLGGTADAGGGLFVAAPSGNGDAQMLVKLDTANPGAAWSPDGRSLVYAEGGDLWIIPTVAGAKPQRLLELAGFPAISPDGRLLAYQSGTPGQPEVYLTTFPVPGMVWPVSGDAGRHPRWNPRGGELFFASGPQVEGDPNSSRDVSAVTVGVLPSVTIGTPRVLFNAYALGFRTNIRGARGYDVGPDGERLLVQTTGVSGTATITAIQNVASWMGRPH
ncbi:MAG: hypothetical protein OEW17_11115, partial [Gemmatimonadota bacterium]|nr:hypothetical protein [Gemmatimonadota bacterium]